MAMATGQITIIDLNDAVNLQGYLSSTQPKIQFLNTTGTTYNPNWVSTNNTIQAELYKMGEANNIITASQVKTIKWFKNDIEITVSGGGITLNPSGTGNGLNTSITITQNILTALNPAIKFTCQITYSPSAAFDLTPIKITLDIDFGLTRQGEAGADAQIITLSSTGQVFKVPESGSITPSTITVTGSAQNTSISLWQYSVNGGSFSTTVPSGVSRTGNTITITGSTMTANTIAVKMGNGSGVEDVLSIAKLVDGASAPVAVLSNESHSFLANVSGSVSPTTVEIDVYGYLGSTQVATTLGAATGLPTGMTATISGSGTTSAKYTITVASASTFGGVNSGTVTLPITVNGQTFNKVFSWAKSLTGATGASGATAKTISLNGPQVFSYNTSGTLIGPSSITLSVSKQNVSSASYTWTYGVDGASPTTSLTASAGAVVFGTDSVQIYPTASIWGTGKSLTIKAVSSEGASILDTFTIFKVRDGAKGDTGEEGLDALTLILSNTNHTVPVDENGNVTYTGSGTTIRLFEGANELTYQTGTTNGTWSATRAVTSGTLTAGVISDSGTYATVANHSSMNTDSAVITYTITGKRATGEIISLTATQALSKAKSGISAVTPSVWTPDGTVFKNANATDEITLQMDLYKLGSVLSSGVTYQWYKGPASTAISGATSKTYDVVASSVDSMEVFKCIATYNGNQYSDTITIIDITDPYQVEVYSSNGNIFKNAVGNTTLTAIVRRNGVVVDPSGATLQYAWHKNDKDGNPEEIVGKETALAGITFTQSVAGTTGTISGTNANFTIGKFYVFGSEIYARRVIGINGTTVTLDEATTIALGSSLSIYPITSNKEISVDSTDIDEKATYFVDVGE
ncbi:MAG: hypothetical protein M0R38_12155 [Bacteroidia bacterium]|nr:hypothetical protein [Bacteroidia bacterium]